MFCTHPILKTTLIDFQDKDFSLRIDMEILPTGSAHWCMAHMQRLLLLDECKEECRVQLQKTVYSDIQCQMCGGTCHIDKVTSSRVCKACGISVDILMDDKYDYSTASRFNGNRRHHYDPTEHFYQSLCDFTCTGARRVPPKIFEYCSVRLGRGPHISSHDVFSVLQKGGYMRYYLYKYEITNRLRGVPEFIVTSREISAMKDVYRRYRSEFIPFQQLHRIGTCSMNGKPRIFWPMRYILKMVCKEIGRDDLVYFIRGVRDKKKSIMYDKYWYKLKSFLDSTRPKRDRSDRSVLSVQLRPKVRVRL